MGHKYHKIDLLQYEYFYYKEKTDFNFTHYCFVFTAKVFFYQISMTFIDLEDSIVHYNE